MTRRNQRPRFLLFLAFTANSIDLELAKYAQSRTRNTEVRKFAATMIADHAP